MTFRESRWPEGLYRDEVGYRFDGQMTADQFGDGLGRNDLPELLYDLWMSGSLNVAEHPSVVTRAWSAHDWPTRALEADVWIQLFDEAGYTHDGLPADRPSQPVTVYRGCSPEARFGMSWTTDLDLARRFASGQLWAYPIPGDVYVFTAAPVSLLAFIHESDRKESEYVIEPDCLNDDDVKVLSNE